MSAPPDRSAVATSPPTPSSPVPASRVAAPRLHLFTVLRFFAATWVLVFHLQSRAPTACGPIFFNFLANGALAMTLFFVLSGTVLALGYGQLRLVAPDLIAYYRSRLARIMPAFWAVQLLALLWFTPSMIGGWDKWAYVNIFSFAGLQAWFPQMFNYGANSGTWSVSAELFFYAMFPLLLPVVRYLRQRLGSSRLFLYVILWSALFGLAEYVLGGAALYYILPYCRLPEFVVGIAIGLELSASRPAPTRPGLQLAVAALIAAAVSFNPAHLHGLWTRAHFIVVPAFAWFMWSLARYELAGPRPSWDTGWRRILLYLGEMSYCLFLAQLVPLMFLDSPAGQAWNAAQLRPHGPLAVWFSVIACSLVGGVFLHEAVEKPARRAWLRHRPKPAGGSATTGA